MRERPHDLELPPPMRPGDPFSVAGTCMARRATFDLLEFSFDAGRAALSHSNWSMLTPADLVSGAASRDVRLEPRSPSNPTLQPYE